MIRYTLLISLLIINIVEVIHSTDLQVSAKQALLIDLNTGIVLFDKNAQEVMPPSSMLKIMTAYTVFSELQKGTLRLGDNFTVSKNAWKKGVEGTRTFLNIGSKVTIENLLRGLIVQSGNDAAVVLAEGISGTEENFSIHMTNLAHKIGAKNAKLTNASGLPAGSPLMSAYDIATIARHTIKDFPQYYKLYSEKKFRYNGITQNNRNPLLYSDIDCDGLKTGKTNAGGFSLVASAKQQDRRLILVLNGCKTSKERAALAKRLMQWGFNNFTTIDVVKAYEDILDYVKIWGGNMEKLALTTNKNIKITVAKDQLNEVKLKLEYDSPVKAPIAKGQIIGQLSVIVPNQSIKKYALVAKYEVKKANIFLQTPQQLKYLMLNAFNAAG